MRPALAPIAVALALVGLQAASAGAQVLPSVSIGGSSTTFEQVLGGPNDASIGPQLHFQRCAGSDIDQFIVLAPGDQVWTIERDWCELASRSPEERFADARRFLPPDAVPNDSFTTDLGEPALSYQSPALATSLPAALFHDCSGNAVPAGTLFIVADSFGGWYMGPGSCPSPAS
jgi:hypothetical protein